MTYPPKPPSTLPTGKLTDRTSDNTLPKLHRPIARHGSLGKNIMPNKQPVTYHQTILPPHLQPRSQPAFPQHTSSIAGSSTLVRNQNRPSAIGDRARQGAKLGHETGVEADRASDSLKSTLDLALTAERDQSEAGDRYLAMKPVEHKPRSPVVLPHDTTRPSFIISSKTAPPTTHTVATSSRVQTAGRGDRSGLKPVVVKTRVPTVALLDTDVPKAPSTSTSRISPATKYVIKSAGLLAAEPEVAKRPLRQDNTQIDHPAGFTEKRRFDIEDLIPSSQPSNTQVRSRPSDQHGNKPLSNSKTEERFIKRARREESPDKSPPKVKRLGAGPGDLTHHVSFARSTRDAGIGTTSDIESEASSQPDVVSTKKRKDASTVSLQQPTFSSNDPPDQSTREVKKKTSKTSREDEDVTVKPVRNHQDVQVSPKVVRTINPAPPTVIVAGRATSPLGPTYTVNKPGDGSSVTIVVKTERDRPAEPPSPSKQTRPRWACLPRKEPVSRVETWPQSGWKTQYQKARDAILAMSRLKPSKKMKGKKKQVKRRRSTQSPERVPVNISVEALMEGISLSQLEDESFEDGAFSSLYYTVVDRADIISELDDGLAAERLFGRLYSRSQAQLTLRSQADYIWLLSRVCKPPPIRQAGDEDDHERDRTDDTMVFGLENRHAMSAVTTLHILVPPDTETAGLIAKVAGQTPTGQFFPQATSIHFGPEFETNLISVAFGTGTVADARESTSSQYAKDFAKLAVGIQVISSDNPIRGLRSRILKPIALALQAQWKDLKTYRVEIAGDEIPWCFPGVTHCVEYTMDRYPFSKAVYEKLKSEVKDTEDFFKAFVSGRIVFGHSIDDWLEDVEGILVHSCRMARRGHGVTRWEVMLPGHLSESQEDRLRSGLERLERRLGMMGVLKSRPGHADGGDVEAGRSSMDRLIKFSRKGMRLGEIWNWRESREDQESEASWDRDVEF